MLPKEVYISRRQAAEYIRLCGFSCSYRTLAKMACVGGGPKYHVFGRMAVYLESDLEAWIAEKLRSPEEKMRAKIEAARGSAK